MGHLPGEWWVLLFRRVLQQEVHTPEPAPFREHVLGDLRLCEDLAGECGSATPSEGVAADHDVLPQGRLEVEGKNILDGYCEENPV